MTLILRWRAPERPIATRWRGPEGMAEAVARDPALPIAAIVGPPGPPGPQPLAPMVLSTAIPAQHFPAPVTAIHTSGYSATGKGAGRYVSDALATAGLAAAHPRLCKQSLDGRYWRLDGEIEVTKLGAIGDGTTDDTAAIVAAQNALAAQGGGELHFAPGTYRTTAPITMAPGVTYKGAGRSALDLVAAACGAKIVNSASDIFVNSASIITGVKFENIFIYAETGGGHIFNWSSAGLVAKVEMTGCVLIQDNPAKAVINGTSAGGIFSIWFHDFEYGYATGNTIPAINIISSTVNSVVLDRFWSTCATGATSGTYSVHIESTNPGGAAFNCLVGHGVFELPGGGAVRLLSCAQSGIEDCAVYDLAVTPNNEMFYIGKGAGPASSQCNATRVRSTVGTTLKPDLKIDLSVTAQGNFVVEECTLAWLDGGSATAAPGATLRANDITNLQNIAYTMMGGSATLDLKFGTTDPAAKSWTFWNGYTGNWAGHFSIEQNGTYVGGYSPSGLFQWGGTRGSPAIYITQGGDLFTKGAFYPATPAGSDQGVCQIFAGSGAPGNAQGADGAYYFRSDGTKAANTAVYHKEAGVWIALQSAAGGGGGGLSDADYGDVTVSGTGTVMTIDAGAVTLAKMAEVATGTVFYRKTAATGAPEVQTLATLKTDLGLTGTNSGDQTSIVGISGSLAEFNAALTGADFVTGGGTATGTNTGDQTTITGNAGTATTLQTSRNFSIAGGGITAAAVGFDGSASVALSASVDAGHITMARMADIATGSLIYRKTAGTGAPEIQTLATLKTDLGLTGTNSGDQTITLTGNVTGSGTGSFATTIAAGAVTLAMQANVAANSFIGNNTGAGATPLALSVAQAKSLLAIATADVSDFNSAARAQTEAELTAGTNITITPAGSGATRTLTIAATGGGGGSPGGATGELQYNNAGAFAGAANVEVDSGNLKLVSTTDPAAPTGGLVLYSKLVAGRHLPKMIGPSGIDTVLQVGLHGNAVFMVAPASGTTAPTAWGGTLTTATTMSMQLTVASANPWQATQRKRFASAGTAGSGSGMRTAYVQWFRGNAAGFGGFFFRTQIGQNLNVNGAQCFHGLCASTAVLATTAGAVSALLNSIGMGYDTTDSSAGNWQIFRNDGSGTATKVDLGANAARNTTHGYDLIIYCPPGAATEIFVRVVNIHTNVVVLDTSYTTDLPTVNVGMAYKAEGNNGAVASAINLEVAKVYIESDY